jgi:predicted nucleic acid-binding protein
LSAIYLDSSAIVKLVAREAESDALRRYLASADGLASSVLSTVEVSRAVNRAGLGSTGTIAAVFETLNVLAFDSRIAARAGALGPAGLRTLDAIHLATALELGELVAFVCYDERLSAAALDLGLPVVAPSGESR